MEYFPEIMDYNFTANVEKQFDEVAEGKQDWHKLLRDFYQDFDPQVERTLNEKTEHRVGERTLGNDPKTGKVVSVKIGRYGPVVQLGETSNEEKPDFCQSRTGSEHRNPYTRRGTGASNCHASWANSKSSRSRLIRDDSVLTCNWANSLCRFRRKKTR